MEKSKPFESIDTNRGQLDDVDDSDEGEPEKGFIAAAQVKLGSITKMDKVVSHLFYNHSILFLRWLRCL
jgi:DNA repair and recombination protein RAD54B